MNGVAAGHPAPVTSAGSLEDLPSYLDGPDPVAVAEGAASPERPVHERPFVSGAVLPAQSLCLYRSTALTLSFPRAIDLPFEVSVAALHRWWRRESREGELVVQRSRLVGPPRLDQTQYRLDVRLGRLGWPTVAMELEFEPWFTSFGTKLVLHPRRTLRPARRYFLAGHALMDGVTAALILHAAH
jgi:hypothetical protein